MSRRPDELLKGIITDDRNAVRTLTIDNPPVNALSEHIRTGLWAAMEAAENDPSVHAVIVTGARSFIAGADMGEFGKPVVFPPIRELLARIGRMTKPVISAITGNALGGGLELALACSFRIAAPDALFGFPEVTLGLLPGAGGSQRLPRVVGARLGLDLILSARRFGAKEALDLRLIDDVSTEPVAAAQALVESLLLSKLHAAGGDHPSIAHSLPEMGDPAFFEAARADVARRFPDEIAPRLIIDCVEAAGRLPLEEGIAFERDAFFICAASPQHRALTYQFRASGQLRKAVPQCGVDAVAMRLSQAMAREAAAMVNEGVISRASDADVVAVKKLGFPRSLGGPVYQTAIWQEEKSSAVRGERT